MIFKNRWWHIFFKGKVHRNYRISSQILKSRLFQVQPSWGQSGSSQRGRAKGAAAKGAQPKGQGQRGIRPKGHCQRGIRPKGHGQRGIRPKGHCQRGMAKGAWPKGHDQRGMTKGAWLKGHLIQKGHCSQNDQISSPNKLQIRSPGILFLNFALGDKG